MRVWEIDFGAKKGRFGDFVVKNGDFGAKSADLGQKKFWFGAQKWRFGGKSSDVGDSEAPRFVFGILST